MNMQSEEINELADALSKAQGLIDGASKDATNPFHKSRYADLHSVISCAKEPLAANNLSVVQQCQVIEGQTCLVTMLMHKSGQWVKSVMPLVTTKTDAQSMGALLTYYRRYGYSALIGISAVDDDGESAMDRKPPVRESANKEKPVEAPKPPTAPSIDSLMLAMAKVDLHVDKSNLASFLAKFAVSKNTTVEAVIKSALTTPEQLHKLKGHLEDFIVGNEPEAA